MRTNLLTILLAIVILVTPALSAEIHVPGDYPTIQAAINAASSGDTIYVAAGRYREALSITKSITILGAGSTLTTVYSQVLQSPLVTIVAPSVKLQGLEFNGGEYDQNFDYYNGVSPIGISATNTNLELSDVYVNQFANKHVSVNGGSLDAKDVVFFTRDIFMQCDLGFDLNGCDAFIDNFRQERGWIDHTININEDPSFGFADVTVQHSVIMANEFSYGDCIRSRQEVNLTVYDCTLYRNPGLGANDPNTGVNIAGYNTDATITQSHFSGMPTGILFGGSFPDSNRMVVEQNSFTDCTKSGVFIGAMHYEGIDLGQGPFGSIGQNTFSNPTTFDVMLDNTEVDIHAAFNSWSYPTIGTGIWDFNDDPSLGLVIYQWKPPRLNIRAWSRVPIIPELKWDPVGGNPIYNVQVSERPNFKTMVFQANVMTNYIRLTGGLPTGKSYFWRVQSQNPWGTSQWSRLGRFTMESISLLPGPVLLSPTSGSILNSVVPILRWEALRDAISYHIQVSTSPDFSVLILDNTEIADPRDVLAPLQPNTTFYWHVRGIIKSGFTDWSPTFNFKTKSVSACTTLTIFPTSQTISSSGGASSITVTTNTGCCWTASSNVSWITFPWGSSGCSNGTVNYSVAANSTGSQRSGTITITGGSYTKIFLVTQNARPIP